MNEKSANDIVEISGGEGGEEGAKEEKASCDIIPSLRGGESSRQLAYVIMA